MDTWCLLPPNSLKGLSWQSFNLKNYEKILPWQPIAGLHLLLSQWKQNPDTELMANTTMTETRTNNEACFIFNTDFISPIDCKKLKHLYSQRLFDKTSIKSDWLINIPAGSSNLLSVKK